MKWIALALVVLGLVLMIAASRMKSSFEDGSFFGQSVCGLAGGVFIVGGALWFVVLLFLKL